MATSRLTASIRGIAYIAGFVLLNASLVLAREPAAAGGSADVAQIDLVKWGITQGGLVLVTLVILWSYRRDFNTVLATQRSEIEVLTELVTKSTAAMTDAAAASREQTRSIERFQVGHP
jgi:hypothetical protein